MDPFINELLADRSGCPLCCNNICTDERGIDAGMAMGLWTQYYYCLDNGLDPLQPVHAASAAIWKGFTDSGSQFEWWRFIYRDPDGRKGWWGMYPDGVTWVRNLSSVPKYARLVWNRELGKRSAELITDDTEMGRQRVTIREAMGEKFDFDDLMSRRSPYQP